MNLMVEEGEREVSVFLNFFKKHFCKILNHDLSNISFLKYNINPSKLQFYE